MHPEGTTWTAGAPGKSAGPSTRDSNVFRRFAAAGVQIGAFVPLSHFAVPMSAQAVFDALDDGIVWYSSQSKELIELSAAGLVRKVDGLALPLEHTESGYAVTSSGRIYVTSRRGTTWTLSQLDRAKGTWRTLEEGKSSGSSPMMNLSGADGNLLVGWTDTGHLRFWNVVDR